MAPGGQFRPSNPIALAVEVLAYLRRVVRRIRKRWPKTRITFRGDGHYARPEAMAWFEDNGVDYIFRPARPKASVQEDRRSG